MTIKERIKLNNLEYFDLLKSYVSDVLSALFNHYYNKEEINEMIERLQDYKKELLFENDLLTYLNNNIENINLDELDRVLSLIDKQNEETYKYYQSIGESYEVKSCAFGPLIYPDRTVRRIDKNYDLIDEVKGLTISLDDIANYYDNSEAYKYTVSRMKEFDSDDHTWFGLFGEFDKDEVLLCYRIIVPPIKNLETALINIHELKHGIDLYPYLNKQIPETIDFEEQAREEEKKFRKEYVRNK